MSLTWVQESPPRWDADKARILGAAAPGVFERLRASAVGADLPGDWWRVERDGKVVGYGWMDVTWGDAEVLLATDPAAGQSGIGTFILEHLEAEAGRQGLRYLCNVVPEAHPDPHGLAAWLERRGFRPSGERWMLRRRVSASRP